MDFWLKLLLHSLDRDAEDKIYSDDDDDEISGSGQNGSGDSFDFHDTVHKESFLSRDQAHHKLAGRDRHGHEKKKENHSRTTDFGGGAGILLSLVVMAFVLGVVSIIFLRR